MSKKYSEALLYQLCYTCTARLQLPYPKFDRCASHLYTKDTIPLPHVSPHRVCAISAYVQYVYMPIVHACSHSVC